MKEEKIIRINKQIDEIEREFETKDFISDASDFYNEENSGYVNARKKLIRIKSKVLNDEDIDQKKLNKSLKRISKMILKEFDEIGE